MNWLKLLTNNRKMKTEKETQNNIFVQATAMKTKNKPLSKKLLRHMNAY